MENTDRESAQATAMKLVAALQEYSRQVDVLVRIGWEIENYKAAADLFAEMRSHAASLPEVYVGWLELLISRYEFAQALWEVRTSPDAAAHLSRCHAKHAAAIVKLHAGCAAAYGAG